MKTPSFITVRTSSSRLPQKCLLPFGDGNVLEHIIRRARHYGLDPIVCTSTKTEDNVIEQISKRERVLCFRGSLNNKLKRWLDCCNHFNIEKFHAVDADDPFFDGKQMKESFRLLNEGYDMVCPTESSSAGGASVGFSLTKNIIAKACEFISEDEDTEMMWYYVKKVEGIKKIVLPEPNASPVKVRLTLDYEEDYWLLESVRKIVGNLADRETIENLFRNNPDLYKINWFRNEGWQERQLKRNE